MLVSKFGPDFTSVDWTPQDQGLITWTFEPSSATNGAVLSPAGTVHTFKMHVLAPVSVTNIIICVATAGSTLTAGQCFGALYQNGTLIGVTADQATPWASTGRKTMALVGGPFNITAGDVVVGLWYNGTTGPTLRGGPADSLAMNTGLATANLRFGKADTGRTTTAPSPLGTITAESNVPGFVALS